MYVSTKEVKMRLDNWRVTHKYITNAYIERTIGYSISNMYTSRPSKAISLQKAEAILNFISNFKEPTDDRVAGKYVYKNNEVIRKALSEYLKLHCMNVTTFARLSGVNAQSIKNIREGKFKHSSVLIHNLISAQLAKTPEEMDEDAIVGIGNLSERLRRFIDRYSINYTALSKELGISTKTLSCIYKNHIKKTKLKYIRLIDSFIKSYNPANYIFTPSQNKSVNFKPLNRYKYVVDDELSRDIDRQLANSRPLRKDTIRKDLYSGACYD